MVYIVLMGVPSVYSYSGIAWDIDKIFSSQDSAEKYIEEQKKMHGPDVEYDIDVREIYA